MAVNQHWQQRIGRQRDWIWRGWQTRYTYLRGDRSASPLILLHGFGASIEQWRHNLPTLSQKHTVYALDLLGFGGSTKAPTDYNINLWVQQVYDFWQTFIGQPVVLVGNSIGSLVCMVAASTHPEMVKGIVLLSLPDVSMRQEKIPRWLQPVVSTIEGTVASPLVLKFLFKVLRRPKIVRRWVGIAYANQDAVTEELVEILAAPAQDDGAARAFCALFKALSHPEFAPSAKAVLPTLTIPTLLIWGRQDRMVPFSLAQTFASLNPQIDLIVLDAGHCPHDECPDQFNQVLLNWLKSFARLDNPQTEETSYPTVT